MYSFIQQLNQQQRIERFKWLQKLQSLFLGSNNRIGCLKSISSRECYGRLMATSLTRIHDVKLPTIIQNRGIRRYAAQNSKPPLAKDDQEKLTPEESAKREQFLANFNSAFKSFLKKWRLSWVGDESVFRRELEKLVNEFNQKHADSGLRIKMHDIDDIKEILKSDWKWSRVTLMLFFLSNLLISLSLLIFLREIIPIPNTGQPLMSLDEFVQKYLSSGEVTKIHYNELRQMAQADLHPDAKIDGKLVGHSNVHIKLDPEFWSSEHFIQQIREAEDELGIGIERIPIEVQQPSLTPSKLLLMICFLFVTATGILIRLARYKPARKFFRVVPSLKKAKKN